MININSELADILIVDDDRSVVIALNKALQPIGRIRFASDANQAFEMIAQSPPDLILLDVELPDINGLEVCSILKQRRKTKDIPVLFITSHTEIDFEEKVFDVGAADYIVKPLNPVVVLARVQTHLNYQRAITLLTNLASTDSMTGLANRRAFDERLCTEFKRCKRDKSALTVAILDIDQFKKYNDHFGHLEGDECIRIIASTLEKHVRRPADFVARYGGEEFALILPNIDSNGAQVFLNELLKSITDLSIVHAPSSIYDVVTISIGFSSCLCCSDELDIKSFDGWALVDSADSALYESKQNGRNKVTYKPVTIDLVTD
ncbi:diguanylate cyclase [Vibrio sp. TH_r3]|uniref:GGDEF domain-containing protein n=1 Tax=Vibrio sp. TH_r3 TaxID=3082084 RepID=UPI0029554F00|nr:diguanylate cyclase [Vibrio sp. TH_r3]MDV7103616.1 diguanylate cyclase [Vibrio sp. TH_r3]